MGKCTVCDTELKELLTSTYCPNDNCGKEMWSYDDVTGKIYPPQPARTVKMQVYPNRWCYLDW